MTSYTPFSGKLPTVSEYSKETFLFKSVFAEFRNSGLQGCNVREKVQFREDFFEFFEISEHPFLSEHFENVSVVHSGSSL